MRFSALVLALAIVIGLALILGPRQLDLASLVFSENSVERQILIDLRLPRVIAAVLAGAALGVSGLVTQTALNNHLADPGLVGINAGAILGGMLVVRFIGYSPLSIVIACVAGALVITSTLLAIASQGRKRFSSIQLLISGMALSAVFGGAASVVALSDPTKYASLRTWLAGSLGGRQWETLPVSGTLIVIALVLVLLQSHSLDALLLGADKANSLGVWHAATMNWSVMLVATLAGSAVALAGPLAFIGLAIPHIARRFSGSRHSSTIMLSAIAGSAALVISDTLARIIIAPAELPVSLLIAAVGAPIFIALVAFPSRGTSSFKLSHDR